MESDDDDEFGDFGGFEAAEVVGPKVAQPLPEAIAAAASPWAFIPSAGVDEADPKEASDTSAEAAKPIDEEPVTDGIKSIDLDKISPTQVTWACWPAGVEPSTATDDAAAPSHTTDTLLNDKTATGEGDVAKSHEELEENKKRQQEVEEARKTQELLTSQLEAVNEEKAQLEKKLDSLTKLLQGSQQRVEEVEEQLAKQKEHYQQLQAQHEEQIEALKKAGHDALAIIVEEYKGVCQTALREQQATFEIQIKEVAKQQLDAWNTSIQTQNDEFKDKMSEEREKLTQHVADTMTKQQEDNKVQLDAVTTSERERSVLAVEAAVQSERSASKVAIEEALNEQRNLSSQALKQHQEHLIVVMEEERSTIQTKLDVAVEKHKEYIQEHINKVVQEERLRSDEHLKKSVATMEEEVRQSMKQRSQAEAAVRHRALTAIDLFLDSARGQLKVLLDTKSFDDSS